MSPNSLSKRDHEESVTNGLEEDSHWTRAARLACQYPLALRPYITASLNSVTTILTYSRNKPDVNKT
ncbi:hypothetical protein LPH44_00515 [Xylella taiwanensis]|uniref:Uncharacterized protein n=1 Tax=Xylella taiwanensis TaxID=1444770 RepID=A0ABS8TS45_9GAMM|nr:hypothetical protein [Xylella taiwanensis]MCD8469825.1 hypothetical protein [Xylella taiwanensis]MCD8472889.1 hypothetical protein [Xylella taiwanensis]UFN05828.1 hypothetical protein LPH42_06065 [Xylella taiwanensis]UFN08121.1 hypothetical protein LPH45_06080 [Xylella taiwanensis]UFN11434.1 hypothetical protein LPH44_00515 [Xylella taiwanensis]